MSGSSGLTASTTSTTTSVSSGAPQTEKRTFVLRNQGSARLAGKRAGMVVFSSYPADPRPRRAAEALLDGGDADRSDLRGGRQIPAPGNSRRSCDNPNPDPAYPGRCALLCVSICLVHSDFLRHLCLEIACVAATI